MVCFKCKAQILWHSISLAFRIIICYDSYFCMKIAAGEAQDCSLTFDVGDALSRWDERAQGYVTDAGQHGLFVGDCNVNGVMEDDRACVQLRGSLMLG